MQPGSGACWPSTWSDSTVGRGQCGEQDERGNSFALERGKQVGVPGAARIQGR